MTVESTLQDMFDHYPTLFATRGQCYNHLFCTIGNGYDWIDGQLIATEHQGKEFKSLHEDDYKKEYIPRAHQSHKNYKMKMKLDGNLWKYLVRNEKIDEQLAKDYVSGKKTLWYPSMCQYSEIFNIPNDIRSDWKEAAIECFKMLQNDGVIDKLQKDYEKLIVKTKKALGV